MVEVYAYKLYIFGSRKANAVRVRVYGCNMVRTTTRLRIIRNAAEVVNSVVLYSSRSSSSKRKKRCWPGRRASINSCARHVKCKNVLRIKSGKRHHIVKLWCASSSARRLSCGQAGPGQDFLLGNRYALHQFQDSRTCSYWNWKVPGIASIDF